MFCKYCGDRIDDDSVFCPVCGERVAGGMQPRDEKADVSVYEEPETELTSAVPETRVNIVKEDEFIDIFKYWQETSTMKKVSLMFVCAMVAAWAAMLILSVFFAEIFIH